jgi:multisubunit Na+/H+ antiporter MnhE subunit
LDKNFTEKIAAIVDILVAKIVVIKISLEDAPINPTIVAGNII